MNGQMISLLSLMFKSRSCHCASLREGVRKWGAHGLKLAAAVPFSWSARSQLRCLLSLQGQHWRQCGNKVAGKENRSDLATPGHYKGITTVLWWDVVGGIPLLLQWLPSPSWHTGTPRPYASCIHVLKKLSPAKMDWSTDPHIKNFQ